MTYKYAVLKTINNKLCVEVNENKKPEFECSNHTLEGKIYQGRVLNEWQQSCKYLEFSSEYDMNLIKSCYENTPNLNLLSIIEIKCKEQLMCDPPIDVYKVYFKMNDESRETWKDIFKKYMEEYPDYYSKYCEKSLPKWLEENYNAPTRK